MLNNHVLQKFVLFSYGKMFFAENARHRWRSFWSGAATWTFWQGKRLQDTIFTVWERDKRRRQNTETNPGSLGGWFLISCNGKGSEGILQISKKKKNTQHQRESCCHFEQSYSHTAKELGSRALCLNGGKPICWSPAEVFSSWVLASGCNSE